MEFRIIGPLEVLDEAGSIPVGGSKQRALLALLLLHPNETLSRDWLIDELWGERPPATAAKTLQVHISRLRRTLAGAWGNGTADGVLVTREHGYQLRLDPERLDAHRLARLVAEGRRELAEGRPEHAVRALEEALSLWRGAPLGEFASEPFAQREIARLQDLRVAAQEQLVEARLELGNHDEVVAQLETLIREHPYRERFRAQLMLALYRSDRQADALQAFQDARRTLVGDLGIEPGERLRELERAILAQDPRLLVTVTASQAPTERPGTPAAGSFVGREAELATLVGALDDASAGCGRLVLIAGEPGIGKSRLAGELTARARARATPVLVGRCWEAGGAPAYWPWVQSLGTLIRETDAAVLPAQLGAGAADLATILPELRELYPDLPQPPALDSDGARFRLFAATSAFLQNATRARPLVLVLDDLHAADEPSLLLLRFLAREIGDSRLLIVCAYRDVDPSLRDPLSAALAELIREQRTTQLALAGLTESDVAGYIELATGDTPSPRLAHAVHERTDGNPLFVTEVVRLLDGEGRIADSDAHLRIPAGVRAAINQRVGRLSSECTTLLVVASVIGREFGLAALGRLSGLAPDGVLEVLDEAMRERVVSDVPESPSRLRFAHALIRDTIYGELATARRLRMHRAVADALQATYRDDLEPHLAEIAHHFAKAAPAGEHEPAMHYARRAGERAMRLLAFEEAVRLYRMAIAALDASEAPDERTRCELLLALGEAQARSGEMVPAMDTLARAADLAKRLELPGLLAAAAIGYGGRFVWVRSGRDSRIVPLLQDALAALPDEDSVPRVKLLARLAGAIRDRPAAGSAASISREAVEMARRLGDAGTLAYALDGLYAGIVYPQQATEWRAMADELVEAAEAAGDKERAWAGHQHRLGPLMLAGEVASVDAELRTMERLVEELRQPAQVWAHLLSHTMRLLFAGRFEEAEAAIERGRELGHRAQTADVSYTGSRLLQLFVLRRAQGRLDEIAEPLARFAGEHPELLVFRCAQTALCCATGRHAAAWGFLEGFAADDLASLPDRQEWLFGAGLIAEVCAELDDHPRATILYELLIPYAGCNLLNWTEICVGSVSRYLGLLATTLSRWEDAERHFEAAISMDRRTGGRPWRAHAQADYARMLLLQDDPARKARARELASRARDGFRDLGMTVDAEQAEALAEGAGAPARG